MSDPAVEAAWLDYAHDVVAAAEHVSQCRAAGGGCLEDPDQTLRWPGYLGPTFERGRLLLIGNVHRNFASDGVPGASFAAFTSATKRFRDNPRTAEGDAAFLRATRDLYGFGLRRWNVGRGFTRILEQLGLTWDDVAYTNAGKCQQLPGGDMGRIRTACVVRFPPSRLAGAIGAQAVITCSRDAETEATEAGLTAEWFPQRYSHARLDEIARSTRVRLAGRRGPSES